MTLIESKGKKKWPVGDTLFYDFLNEFNDLASNSIKLALSESDEYNDKGQSNRSEYFFKMVPKIRGNLDIFKTEKSMPDSEVTIDYMMDNLWIVGSPDDAVEKIRDLYDHVGGFGVLLVMGHEWKPKDKWTRSMKLLAEDVMPTLRDLK